MAVLLHLPISGVVRKVIPGKEGRLGWLEMEEGGLQVLVMSRGPSLGLVPNSVETLQASASLDIEARYEAYLPVLRPFYCELSLYEFTTLCRAFCFEAKLGPSRANIRSWPSIRRYVQALT
jgi:hypothetical protein